MGTRSLPCSPCCAASEAAVATRAEAPVVRPQKGPEAAGCVYGHCLGGWGKHGWHPRHDRQGGPPGPAAGRRFAGPQRCAQKPQAGTCWLRIRSEAPAGHAAASEVAEVRGGGGGGLALACAVSRCVWGGCKRVIPHPHGFLPACPRPPRLKGAGGYAGASGAGGHRQTRAVGAKLPVSVAGQCTAGWPGAPPVAALQMLGAPTLATPKWPPPQRAAPAAATPCALVPLWAAPVSIMACPTATPNAIAHAHAPREGRRASPAPGTWHRWCRCLGLGGAVPLWRRQGDVRGCAWRALRIRQEWLPPLRRPQEIVHEEAAPHHRPHPRRRPELPNPRVATVVGQA